jgi:3-hydroxybutyryl-CoA dehydrogenase
MAQKIGVIGAGQMGSGIAQLFATYGHQTVVLDLQVAALDRAKSGIAKSLEKLAAKQVIASDVPSQAMAKLSFASEFSALSACDRGDYRTRVGEV